ncbi:MAG: acetyltransferase [Magnetospirillum sp.]|nr:acetyltransferase [Magnetospirillum sp.]
MGRGGHAKVLREFEAAAGYRTVALVDNDPSVISPWPELPVLAGEAGLRRYLADNPGETWGAIAIGGLRGGDRMAIQNLMADCGLHIATMVHPTAFVATTARVGEGSQILARAAVCAEAEIGRATIVNTSASVDHETRLGDGVHIAPGATLAGCIDIGDYVFIGPGAVVTARCRIGQNSVVAAGAVVLNDVVENTKVYGVPAQSRLSRHFKK